MTELLASKYAGFIFSAYGITFAVLFTMIVWVVLTGRARRKQLAQLEADGLRRSSSTTKTNARPSK